MGRSTYWPLSVVKRVSGRMPHSRTVAVLSTISVILGLVWFPSIPDALAAEPTAVSSAPQGDELAKPAAEPSFPSSIPDDGADDRKPTSSTSLRSISDADREAVELDPIPGERTVDVSIGDQSVLADIGLRISSNSVVSQDVSIETLPKSEAERLSPFGLALSLSIKDRPKLGGLSWEVLGEPDLASQPVTLEFDYSSYLTNAGVANRLQLVHMQGCQEGRFSRSGPTCDSMVPLSSFNDPSTGTIRTTLTPESAVASGGLLALSTTASGPEGDYAATPLPTVASYQVGLFTGSFDMSIPFEAPPAPTGPTPSAGLSYSSGSIDGLHTQTNAQASQTGLGWSLVGGGAITRHWYQCAPGNALDICPTGHDYTLSLNGTSSRLILDDDSNPNNILFRLKNDPMWKVQLITAGDGSVPNQDAHGEYWLVTTPDGTTYRFGYEDNSGDHVPFYTLTSSPSFQCDEHEIDPAFTRFCRKVWRWNLDLVTDAIGNETTYTYTQEEQWYAGRDANFKVNYVRASHLNEILYTSNGSLSASSRVLYRTELRCVTPEIAAGCDSQGDFPDVPFELVCRASDICAWSTQRAPTFFSERKLGSVQSQVKDGSAWRTVGWWDLAQTFPDPTGPGEETPSERKLWLDSVTQRPGGDYEWSAFTQIEAEDASSTSLVYEWPADDYGMGHVLRSFHDGDWASYNDVDFGSGATQLIVNYASFTNVGALEFRRGSTTGPLVATVPVDPDVHGQYETTSVPVSSISGVHDVYVVAQNSGGGDLSHVNWFRFTPSSSLPGLPPTTFEEVHLANRVYANSIEPRMRMPRIASFTNPLGGTLEITYGQEHAWDSEPLGQQCSTSSSTGNVRRECDFFVAYDGFYEEWWHWNKWKVMSTLQRADHSENGQQHLTYEYSRPTWHYSDNPGFNSHTGTWPGALTCSSQPCNHWNEFRGHETVKVEDQHSGRIDEYRFYQGMDGDWMGSGGGWTFGSSISLADGSTRTDHEWLTGNLAQTRTFDSTTELTRSTSEFHWISTAGSGVRGAYWTGADESQQISFGGLGLGQPNRTSETLTSYNQYGFPTGITERRHTATTTDDTFTEIIYNPNVSSWILSTPRFVEVWPGTSPGSAGSELARDEFFYDGASSSATDPTAGLVTKHKQSYTYNGSYQTINTLTSYDPQGRVLTTDVSGSPGVTTNTYDLETGFLASTTDPVGITDTFEFDPGTGQLLSTTDPNSNTTTFTYDNYGRPKSTSSSVEEVDYSYNYSSYPVEVSIERHTSTSGPTIDEHHYYDEWGRWIQTQRPGEQTNQRRIESRFYNNSNFATRNSATPFHASGEAGSGWVDPTWTGSSPTVDLQYFSAFDVLGRMTRQETIADDSAPGILWASDWTYDAWAIRETDREGNVSTSLMNGHGLLAQLDTTSSGGPITTTYSYDGLGRLTQLVDDGGNTTSVGYDMAGRRTSLDDPNSGLWNYTYNELGLVETQTSPTETVWNSYDGAGRPLERRLTNSSGPLLASWTYDAPGQLGLLASSIAYNTDADITIDPLAYDAANRVISQRWGIDDGSSTDWLTMDWTYDKAGRLTAVEYPDGETVSYSFNSRTGLPTGADRSDGFELVSSASYTPSSLPVNVRFGASNDPLGVDRDWVYQAASQRLGSLKATAEGATFSNVQNLSYSYSPNGNVTRRMDWRNSAQAECFEFDSASQLTRAFTTDDVVGSSDDCSNGPVPIGNGIYEHDYQYDTIGNLIGVDGATWTYGAGGAGPNALTNAAASVAHGMAAATSPPPSAASIQQPAIPPPAAASSSSGGVVELWGSGSGGSWTVADGADWDWTHVNDRHSVVSSIVGGLGRLDDYSPGNSNWVSRVHMSVDGEVFSDVDVVTEFTVDRHDTDVMVGLRRQSEDDLYMLGITDDGNNGTGLPQGSGTNGNHLQILRRTGGSVTLLAETPFTYPDGSYWIRANAEGDQIRLKVWTGTKTDEPANWTLTATDTTYTSGGVGIASSGKGNSLLEFSEFTATDPNGGPTNQPPTAVATSDVTNGDVPLTVNFDGTGSTDPENGTLTYAWDLDGDGQTDDSTSATPAWTYTTANTYTVTLEVTDPQGATDTTTLTITTTDPGPGVGVFSYDSAGRTVSRTVDGVSQTLSWTPTGFVESISGPEGVVSFSYDADGDRVLRVDASGRATVTLGTWHEYHDPPSGGETSIDHYWFGGERIGYESTASGIGTTYFVLGDLLDTASVVYNHNTGEISREWFDPWGNHRGSGGSGSVSDVGYTGQYQDPSGLMDYNARIYDPGYATFLTPDTIVPNPANPLDLNRYTYVRNNPTTYKDPTGHFATPSRQITFGQCGGGFECYGNYKSSAAVGSIVQGPQATMRRISVAVAKRNVAVAVTVANTIADVTPWAGDVKAANEVLSGTDALGNKLAAWERGLIGVATVIGLGNEFKAALDAATGAGRLADQVPLPDELADGVSDVHVYLGMIEGKPVYTGITNNLVRRQAQHGDRFRLEPLTTDPVTRGQARAIEQALIEQNPHFQNVINSISPRHAYYEGAVDWGDAWLRANG